jgi:hypothetical protein
MIFSSSLQARQGAHRLTFWLKQGLLIFNQPKSKSIIKIDNTLTRKPHTAPTLEKEVCALTEHGHSIGDFSLDGKC